MISAQGRERLEADFGAQALDRALDWAREQTDRGLRIQHPEAYLRSRLQRVAAPQAVDDSDAQAVQREAYARLDRLADAISRFDHWLAEQVLLPRNRAKLSPRETADLLRTEIDAYEQRTGSMHPYFRRQLDSLLAAWDGLDAWPNGLRGGDGGTWREPLQAMWRGGA